MESRMAKSTAKLPSVLLFGVATSKGSSQDVVSSVMGVVTWDVV